MKLHKVPVLVALTAAAFLTPQISSHATLSGFTDYNLGGSTAGWDIFYGDNFLPVFNFSTGGVGNPSDTFYPLTMTADVPNWQPGPPFATSEQAFGPSDSSEDPQILPPGDRELFYTFGATPVNFTITGLVAEGQTLDGFAFQALFSENSPDAFSNVLLNGDTAISTGHNLEGVAYWEWGNLGLTEGSTFDLTFQTAAPHSAFDAVQVQTDAQVVPEPTTGALVLLGGIYFLWKARRKSGTRSTPKEAILSNS